MFVFLTERRSEGEEYRFEYREVQTRYGTILRPYATIFLKNSEGEWITFFSLVDSGADYIIMPKSACELLGYHLEDGEQRTIKGVCCEITVYLHRIETRIGDKVLNAQVLFAEKEVPFLLGREDVFNAFQILFKQRNSDIYFKVEV